MEAGPECSCFISCVVWLHALPVFLPPPQILCSFFPATSTKTLTTRETKPQPAFHLKQTRICYFDPLFGPLYNFSVVGFIFIQCFEKTCCLIHHTAQLFFSAFRQDVSCLYLCGMINLYQFMATLSVVSEARCWVFMTSRATVASLSPGFTTQTVSCCLSSLCSFCTFSMK